MSVILGPATNSSVPNVTILFRSKRASTEVFSTYGIKVISIPLVFDVSTIVPWPSSGRQKFKKMMIHLIFCPHDEGHGTMVETLTFKLF